MTFTLADDEPGEPLPDEIELALAHTPSDMRSALGATFALDARLARIVSGTNEPMLGQMRLAWWRDTLAQPARERPRGDRVLDAITAHFGGVDGTGRGAQLSALVDGWEHMLSDPFTPKDAESFAAGRAAPFGAFALHAGLTDHHDACWQAAREWVLADAAAHIGPGAERQMLLDIAATKQAQQKLPRPLRGLAILAALARRAIDRGGRPLMEGRGASIVAARAAIVGR